MRQIVIILAFFCFQSLSAQQEFILVDALSGEPIPLATIYNKTKNKSLKTNENGKFQLTSSTVNDSFEIRYLGYKRLIFSKSSIDSSNIVKLHPNSKQIGEITIRPGNNDYLVELIQKVKKANAKIEHNSKAYYRLKSYVDGEQVELVESYYNAKIKDYNVERFDMKTGRLGLKPIKRLHRVFTSLESSYSILDLKLFTNSSDIYPTSPLWLNKKKLKEKFYIDIEDVYANEYKDSIYTIYLQPKKLEEYYFATRIWLNKTKLQVEKISLVCPVAERSPFLPLFSADKIENIGFEIVATYQDKKFHQMEFKSNIEYNSSGEQSGFNSRRKANYTISTDMIFYAYDYNESFELPYYNYNPNNYKKDYSTINAFPYNEFFWKYNDESSLLDDKKLNANFFNDSNVFTNKTLFTNTTDTRKLSLFEWPYIHWTGNRILLRDNKTAILPRFDKENLDSIEKEIRHLDWWEREMKLKRIYGANFQPFRMTANYFVDVNTFGDSTNYLLSSVLDPHNTHCFLLLDRKTHCVINLIFDYYEICKRDLEKTLHKEKPNHSQIKKYIDRTYDCASKHRIQLEKLLQWEYDKSILLQRCETVKTILGIDNLQIFEPRLE